MATPEVTASEDPNAMVNEVVGFLMWLNGAQQKDVVEATAIPARTFIRGMQGRRDWSVREVHALARYFEVEARMFFDGPDEEQRELWRAFLTQRTKRSAAVRQIQSAAGPGFDTVTSGKPSRVPTRFVKPGAARYGTHAAAA
jgi:hypothetical protein